MAFGNARGAYWLIVPLIGALLIAVGLSLDGPYEIGPRLLAIGVTVTYVGLILAGLIGHIVWLVPISLLLIAPFVLVYWICSLLFWAVRRLWKRVTA